MDREENNGVCNTGLQAWVGSYGTHHGEDNPLRGWCGSGTIFFSYCNLRCVYCQNPDISQVSKGHQVSSEKLVALMLTLQGLGCHNINLVSPSNVITEILAALVLAEWACLHLPLVRYSVGYDSITALKLLGGVVDIYMPDMKYGEASLARIYPKIQPYPSVNQRAVIEIFHQVGDLQIDEKWLARRGLLVRPLVLHHGLAGTRR